MRLAIRVLKILTGLFVVTILVTFGVLSVAVNQTDQACLNSNACESCDEKPFDISIGNQIVQWVKTGSVHPNKYGRLMLPSQWQHATRDGSVTVTRRPDLLLIFFATRSWRFGPHGYLYCSRPLQHTGFASKHSIAILTGQSYWSPYIPVSTSSGKPIPVGIPLTRQVNTNWWYSAFPNQTRACGE